ncbi:hypothetical protein ACLBKT_02520 [Erythrobacter sp. W302b]|uniref:hypothetical protein n=1 Tax=Erythrobacter sp. W302b TaxID=3389874 RepID=UPI00396B1EB4
MGIQPVPGGAQPPALARDASGRFKSGNIGGGRPKGARNRLTETFLATVVDHFAEHGKAAFDKLATDDPAAYLRIMASFVPREQAREDFGDMTDEEIVEAVERAERHRRVARLIDAGE